MRRIKPKAYKGKSKEPKLETRILAVFKNYEGSVMWEEYLPGNAENYVLDASEIPGVFHYIVNEEQVIKQLRDSLPPDIGAVRLWVLSAIYNNSRQFCVVPHPKHFFDSSLLLTAPFSLQLELPVNKKADTNSSYVTKSLTIPTEEVTVSEGSLTIARTEIIVTKEVYEQLLQTNTIYIRCKDEKYKGHHIPAYTEMEEED